MKKSSSVNVVLLLGSVRIALRLFWMSHYFVCMPYSPFWGCAGDRVEMIVRVHCGSFWGTNLPPCWKCVPPKKSHNALWNHLDPVSRATVKVANSVRSRKNNWTKRETPSFALGADVNSPKLFLDQLYAWINRKLVSGVENVYSVLSGEN